MQTRSNVRHLNKASKLEQALVSIEENLDRICKVYRLITAEQKRVLLKDIKYMLLDNIVEEVKLDFFDPADNSNVFECLCTADGLTEIFNAVDQGKENENVDHVAIDVFFKFTDAFLSIGAETQKIMLCSTEFVWHTDINSNNR
jgi:hypothetical protein